jgi:hypothetical protein
MIYIEKAPTGKTECCDCEKLIELGSNRLVIQYQDGSWTRKNYRCVKCSKKLLKELLKKIS